MPSAKRAGARSSPSSPRTWAYAQYGRLWRETADWCERSPNPARIIARKDGNRVRLYSRAGNDLTDRFPLIVANREASRQCSRSCSQSTRSWPTASRAQSGEQTPSAPPAREPQVKTCCSSASSWLHFLRSWSLRKSRCVFRCLCEGPSTLS
jgi:hypothetical protein